MDVGFQFPKTFIWALTLWGTATASVIAADAPRPALSKTQEHFRTELGARFLAVDKQGGNAVAGADGWLFLAAELRFLSLGTFWGAEAARTSRSPKPDLADPIPAIIDFHRQLKDRGIALLLVPVPPKAAIYPDKIGPASPNPGEDPAPSLEEFYAVLRAQGVDVLDLAPVLTSQRDHERGPVFCRTDTHWSGFGCTLAAHAIAERIREKVSPLPAARTFTAEWKEIAIEGDLTTLVKPAPAQAIPETIRIRLITEQSTAGAVAPDPESPALLLGDSHTLVFHDFLAERAGLLDQLAMELGFAPDLIGTRGSGATPVRISLYRRSTKEPEYMSKKKVVVWCFTAREFTEAAQGWPKLPVAK